MPSESEIAWAAGFFEGEGCCTVMRSARRLDHPGYPMATISNADKECLERFHAIVGVGNIAGPRLRGANKPIWAWTVTGARFHIVIDLLWPWLGTRRRARASEVKAIVSQPWERKRYVRGSRPPISEETRERIRSATLGKKASAETREKMRASQQRRRAQEKLERGIA